MGYALEKQQNAKLTGTFEPLARHALDHRMGQMSAIDQLPLLGSPEFKGGTLPNFISEEVREYLLSADLSKIQHRAIPLSPEGDPLWGAEMRDSLPRCFKDAVQKTGPHFMAFAQRPSEVSINVHMGERSTSLPAFHFDSKRSFEEESRRAIASVTDDPEQRHTDWIATDGLSERQMQALIGSSRHLDDIDPALRNHIQSAQDGELYAAKGLCWPRRDILLDGSAHRSPVFREAQSVRGHRRVTIVFDAPVEDPGMSHD